MAEIQAKTLYDFAGDSGNGELSFYQNEILTIVDQNVGDGWWEACNSMGEKGFIPESYVEITSIPEPSFPPPPPPTVQLQETRNSSYRQSYNSQASDYQRPPSYNSVNEDNFRQSLAQSLHSQQRNENVNRVSNELPDYNQYSQQPSNGYQHNIHQANESSGNTHLTNQDSYEAWEDDDWDDDDSTTTDNDIQLRNPATLTNDSTINRSSSPSDQSKYGTVKKSFSRFSTFAKTGGEAYLLGQATALTSVSETDLIKIIDSTDGPIWEPSQNPYTCMITQPHKESKLKGLKSFIAYQLSPSYSSTEVSRRYKHFDWLHQRLEEKFVCVPIAPLPEKAISGRYEDDFIAERMRLLQLWFNRITKHPVLSQCDVIHHFLTCSDEKKRWKQGKRRAEKDEYTSAKFFLTVQTPPQPLDIKNVEDTTENFHKFVHSMDDSLKHLILVIHNNMKRHTGPFKAEYQKLGNAYKGLSSSFQLDNAPYSLKLTQAIENTGNTYNDIGGLFEMQPKYDSLLLLAGLYEYKGLLTNYPDVLKIQEGALSKAKDCIKQQEEGKLSESDVQCVIQRADVISYCTLAEMKHFQQERVTDFNYMMRNYLQEQINFYKQITAKLEDALKAYEKV